ncbi:hypothetical protein, partial [Escherichia coli]|uniref:hypothetical protein n=1 Tax=Escherichia coli TaxID=562 RepID=UPI0032DB7DA4
MPLNYKVLGKNFPLLILRNGKKAIKKFERNSSKPTRWFELWIIPSMQTYHLSHANIWLHIGIFYIYTIYMCPHCLYARSATVYI